MINDPIRLTNEQEGCYRTIVENDKVLIIKERASGTTTLLAKYVIRRLQEDSNKTICYMLPSSSLNEEFMEIVRKFFNSIYDTNEFIKDTKKELILPNRNKLICMLNSAENFLGKQKIDIFIYDEIGLERGDFPALNKTLGLYGPSKTIFTYTITDCGNITAPYLKEVYEWLLLTDYKRILLPMLPCIQQQKQKDDMYDRIRALYYN